MKKPAQRIFLSYTSEKNSKLPPMPEIEIHNNTRGRSKKWLIDHGKDLYVRLASRDNYPCRSAYKLIHIDEKFKILKPGMKIVDIGAFPGGWSKVASERVKSIKNLGKVIGVDIQPMNEIYGVTVMERSDIRDLTVQERLINQLNGFADAVLSDMAVKACGLPEVDFSRNLELCHCVFKLLPSILKDHGYCVLKITGNGCTLDFKKKLLEHFFEVKNFRPTSCRKASSEYFFVCLDFSRMPINQNLRNEWKINKSNISK